MNISLWRLTHLWLAIITSLFLLIASVTGAILSFEPIYEQSFGYKVEAADQLTLAALHTTVSENYLEVLSLERDHNGYVKLTVLDEEGESTFFIDPFTGERMGEVFSTLDVFEFSRTLHRSLFLGKVGRFLVGITSVFFMIMAFTGFVLILIKQGGFKAYFKKVIKHEFYADYHTKLGKVFIVTNIIISVTGGYLFLDRFTEIGKVKGEHQIDFTNLNESPLQAPGEFEIFKNTKLGDLKSITFPFAEFVDEFYDLKLHSGEYLINQITGEVVSKIDYGLPVRLAGLSFEWHTAEGHPWWAALLGISSLSILFFIYSGLQIYLQRRARKVQITNSYSPADCDYVILYGSEMGSTLAFAQALHKALIEQKKKVCLLAMDALEAFQSMKYLMVVTSTYGVGEAPANAKKFMQKLAQLKANLNPFSYTVAGFGSTNYPDFCQFAIDVDQSLAELPMSNSLTDLVKVNKGSVEEYHQWIKKLEQSLGIEINVELEEVKRKKVELKVRKKVISPNVDDQTFLLELTSKNGALKKYQSGDLLVVRPEEDNDDRYYSMTVRPDKRTALISVRKHEYGIVSNYLARTEIQDRLTVSFQHNHSFHFPENAHQVIMICNGTGIAPFIGMIEANRFKVPITLFWGGRNEDSWKLYQSIIDPLKSKGYIKQIRKAYSQNMDKKYVQDVLTEDQLFISMSLAGQGHVLICGSLIMQKGVEKVLDEITQKNLKQPLSDFQELGLIKSDCY